MDVASKRPFSGDEIPVRIASDVTKANADLIVAAPDLLAACEASLDRMTELSPEFSVSKCVALLRAAIAKARGAA